MVKGLPARRYYPARSRRGIVVRPTRLGLQILESTQARTGRDADDIVEQLLRDHAWQVQFNEKEAP